MKTGGNILTSIMQFCGRRSRIINTGTSGHRIFHLSVSAPVPGWCHPLSRPRTDGKIGGLPDKAADLINKRKDNAKIERMKDALVDIIGKNTGDARSALLGCGLSGIGYHILIKLS